MSLGYADRLSHREDLGGRLGDPELHEPPPAVLAKAERLAELLRGAARVVAFTGAGISTAAGIPDFRGPKGVWTLQRAGLPPPQLSTPFVYATPSLTHQALLGLMQAGKLTYLCSQNVDGLHLRSGVPRAQLAELHGNCFAERCRKCRAEYVRDFEMDTVGFKPTGRRCARPDCRGQLVDHILDWEDALPPDELRATQQAASAADVALALGTSLQIVPAANLPLRTVRAGGALAIVNLQATPKDRRAALVVHAEVDAVMALAMRRLGVPLPVYKRRDRVLLSHALTSSSGGGGGAAAAGAVRGRGRGRGSAGREGQRGGSAAASDGGSGGDAAAAAVASAEQPQPEQQQQQQEEEDEEEDGAAAAAAAAQGADASSSAAGATDAGDGAAAAAASAAEPPPWGFTFTIASVHGPGCPLPMVASARVEAVGPAAALPRRVDQTLSGPPPWRLSRTVPWGVAEVALRVTLRLVDAADADKRVHQTEYAIARPERPPEDSVARTRPRRGGARAASDGEAVFEFVTQCVDHAGRQARLVAELEAAAAAAAAAAGGGAEDAGGDGGAPPQQQPPPQLDDDEVDESVTSGDLEQLAGSSDDDGGDDDDDDESSDGSAGGGARRKSRRPAPRGGGKKRARR